MHLCSIWLTFRYISENSSSGSGYSDVYFVQNVTGTGYTTVNCGFRPKKILIGRSGAGSSYPLSCWYDESTSTSTCYYWLASNSDNEQHSVAINSSSIYISSISDTGFTLGSALTAAITDRKLTILAVG